jgi:hypothetical protein
MEDLHLARRAVFAAAFCIVSSLSISAQRSAREAPDQDTQPPDTTEGRRPVSSSSDRIADPEFRTKPRDASPYHQAGEALPPGTGVAPAGLAGILEIGDIDEEGPYPLPLLPKLPLGSLIYDPSVMGQIATFAAVDDFETGVLGPEWSTSSSALNGRIQVTNAFGAGSGAFALLMDVAVVQDNLNEAIWTVDLSGETSAVLRFLHTQFNDEEDFLPGNFVGSANGDGVSISDDGLSWRRVLGPTQTGIGVWQERIVDLAAAAASAGMSLGADFKIKFQQYDNFPLTTDGRGYDGIEIRLPGIDTDTFEVPADPGQTITVLLESGDSLQATLELREDGTLIASATASAAGEDVILQTVATGMGPDPNLYAITVGGANDTLGTYTLQVILNAAIEEEGHGAPPNDTIATAQDIDASVISLPGIANTDPTNPLADRGAALGTIESIDDDDLFCLSLNAGESTTIAVTKQNMGLLSLDLLDASGTVVAEGNPGLSGNLTNGSFETGDFTGWTVLETGAPFSPWQVTGASFGGGFGMFPTDPQDGSFEAWNGFDGAGPMEFLMCQDVTIPGDVSSAVLEWSDRVQWNFGPGAEALLPRIYTVEIRDPGTEAILSTLLSFSTGVQAGFPTGDTGWQMRSADLSAFTGSTVRVTFRQQIPENFTGPGQIEFDRISLLTSELDEVFANVDQYILDFSATADGAHYVRVSGAPDTDYSLIVLRNACFDLEDNDTFDTARPISLAAGPKWVLGHISGGGLLYGADRNGQLVTIETSTLAVECVGMLPAGSTEIEYDPLSGRAFSQFTDGSFTGQEFDIDTGAGIGLSVFNGASHTGQEWVGTDLYATAILGGGGLAPSELRILDPFTGISTLIGTTGFGPISGLAYDSSSGVMYGIAGGPGPANLYTIDLSSGAATVVGTTSFRAGSLEFGSDGALYGGGTGENGGELYRIDPDTAESVLVGSTGLPGLTGLALRGGSTVSDFYAVDLPPSKTLRAFTFLPATGSGEFVNNLDPMLRVYDAVGNLVAMDDNSEDGRNARVIYNTAAGGIHYIEVTSSDATESPTSGEYLLKVK